MSQSEIPFGRLRETDSEKSSLSFLEFKSALLAFYGNQVCVFVNSSLRFVEFKFASKESSLRFREIKFASKERIKSAFLRI